MSSIGMIWWLYHHSTIICFFLSVILVLSQVCLMTQDSFWSSSHHIGSSKQQEQGVSGVSQTYIAQILLSDFHFHLVSYPHLKNNVRTFLYCFFFCIIFPDKHMSVILLVREKKARRDVREATSFFLFIPPTAYHKKQQSCSVPFLTHIFPGGNHLQLLQRL